MTDAFRSPPPPLIRQQQSVGIWNSSGANNLTSDYLNHLRLTLDLTRFYVLRVAALFVASVGIAANIVNILVLTKRSMKSSTNYYLCALAIFDILYLVSAVTMTFQHQDNDVREMHWYFRYKNICGRTFTDMSSNIAIWLTITFTVERYVGVCYPMRGKLWCTTEKAKRVIPVVCLVAAALTVPEFFQYRIVSEVKLPLNVTVLTRTPTDFGNSTFYHVYNHLRQSLFAFVPVVLLLIFNALLVRTVCAAARERRTLTVRIASLIFRRQERLRRKEQAITVTLITVVLVFLVCQLPQAIQQLYAIYLDLTDQLTKEKNLLLRIQGNYFNLLVMINASANFLLYSAFSYEFRRSFKRLISRRRKPRSIESGRDEEELRVPIRRSALRASK